MDRPGFFNLDVRVEVDGVDYRQWKTVAVDKERIEPTVTMPADFGSYWQSQLDADAAMPLRPRMELLPERCTDRTDVYEVSYIYTPQGGRFYGILCVPKGNIRPSCACPERACGAIGGAPGRPTRAS